MLNRPLLWIGGLAVGFVATLASVLGLAAMVLASLLVIPLVRQTDGRAALSGLLTGLGGVWLLLMASESASGGVLDDAAFWTGVGMVFLLSGLGLAVAIMVPQLTARAAASRRH
jgi:hypothetical protein